MSSSLYAPSHLFPSHDRGGWRPTRSGFWSQHTPGAGEWQTPGSTVQDDSENQFQVASGAQTNEINGFFDRGMYETIKDLFDPNNYDHRVEWLPSWAIPYDELQANPRKFPKLENNNNSDWGYTYVFSENLDQSEWTEHDRAYNLGAFGS